MGATVLSPQEARLRAEQEGSLARKYRTERIEQIFRSFEDKKPRIDIQRARYFTESFRQTEGEPLILRWAKALYHIAEHIPVYIDVHQLIVGRAGAQGRYGLVYPELDGCFLKDAAIRIPKRTESPFIIAPDDVDVILEEIAPYWEEKNYFESLLHSLPKDLLKITNDPDNIYESRYIVTETSTQRSALQWVHDYETGIREGFQSLRDKAQAQLDAADSSSPHAAAHEIPFLEASVIICDAIILWAQRHSDLAAQLAETETDPGRKQELQKIAEVTKKVPRYPAESFYEALQSQWFIQMFSRLEQKTGATISNGRMDQYLYTYYQEDIAAGTLTRDEAKELLECLWISMAQYMDLYVNPAGACFNEAYAHWEAVTIGGVTREGRDAVNELSYLLLESKREFPLNYPDLAARVHARSPERYLFEVAETIKEGSGFPKLINDEEIVPLLVSKGASFEEANDYAVSGCTEVRMPNRDTYTSPCPYVNLGAALELTLFNGRMQKYGEELLTIETGDIRDFKTWEDLWEAYKRQQEYLLKQAFRIQYAVTNLREKHFASPLGSILHELCRKSKKDLHSASIPGGLDLGFFDLIGFGTAVDSLSALKTYVYEKQIFSLEEVAEALTVNFEGAEFIRETLQKAPCYGNDDSYADEIAKAIDREAVSYAKRYSEEIGFSMDLRYVPVTSHIPFGKVVGATPNGRKAGTALSDGSSASHGADKNGPTAILLSNYHSKNTDFKERAARLLNIKINPSCVAGEEGSKKIVSLIKGWSDLKLWHLQFNIINQKTLAEAKKDPEKYKNLLVRVAGYSAYFVDLSPELQDDILLRTEHGTI